MGWWRVEPFRQKGNILFWSFIQGFIYRGRMCCRLEGSVLAGGGECEAVRWVSVCETPEGWKDCEFSPCKTPLRTRKSLRWAKDGTNQRKQQQHFNKHTQTHMLSHSANRLFRSLSWSRLCSHDRIYPVVCTERRWREDEATGCGIFLGTFLLPHSLFTTASFLCSLVPSSLSFSAIPFPTFPFFFISPSLFIEAHGGTLVHAHIGVTEKSACIALDVLGVQCVELLRGHLQVGPYFRAWGHLWDVKAVLTTCQRKTEKVYN